MTPPGGNRLFGGRGGMRSPTEALQPQATPPPPTRQKRRRRGSLLGVASGFLSFILVLAVAALFVVGYGQRVFSSPGPLASDKTVFIVHGTNTSEIVDQLEREGVIENGALFNIGLTAYGKRSRIKAGEYQFKAMVSPDEVMNTLVDGKSVQHSVTLPEGLTSEQIVQRLKDLKDEDGNFLLSGDDVHIPPEGTLMPETYKFTRGDTRESILKRMQEAQRPLVNEIWAHRAPDLPLRSTLELVTLASIVEKETGKPDERARVAGVFLNRLSRHMKLQSDPTIVYGLVGGKGTLGRGILKSEVLEATPYNTYVIDGLPPGPIANPGRAAIEAVANPTHSKELYFVADGTGGHAFAETLDDHQKNVAHWRQIEKDAKDKSPSDAGKPAPPKPAQRTDNADLLRTVDWSDAASDAPYPAGEAAHAPATPVLPAATELAVGGVKVAFGAAIDKLGWQIPGVDMGDGEPAFLRGDDDEGPTVGGPLKSYPLSPARLADMRAREARYGIEPGSTTLPPDLALDPATERTAALGPCTARGPALPPTALDASEGTSLDPLRNTSFDLNSSKTVPAATILLASLNGLDVLPRRKGGKLPHPPERADVARSCAASPGPVASLVVAAADRPMPAAADEARDGAATVKIFDVSEGTSLDPLRNTTFDLNSAQSVPTKPLTLTDVAAPHAPAAKPMRLASVDPALPAARDVRPPADAAPRRKDPRCVGRNAARSPPEQELRPELRPGGADEADVPDGTGRTAPARAGRHRRQRRPRRCSGRTGTRLPRAKGGSRRPRDDGVSG